MDADKHNFGQTVELTERASQIWFQKPRPVFWEQLFFGSQSPIARYFSTPSENGGLIPARYLFNLDIEVEREWFGFSKEIKSSSHLIGSEHYYGFGVLLAYAFAFGIRDLHKTNLILTDTHLQAVDAEIVLVNLILPNETALLPFKEVTFKGCGLAGLISQADLISADNRQNIFAGYFDLFACLFKCHSEIQTTLEAQNLDVPVRVILRNTINYVRHLKGEHPIQGLLPEEKIQLDRGDIPYFFKRITDDALYWLSSKSGEFTSVENFIEFKPDVVRHGRIPSELIGDPALIEKKMVQGAFMLQRQLDFGTSLEFLWNKKRLRLSADLLENEASGRIFHKASGAKTMTP